MVDLVFPPTCGGCKTSGVQWCQNCQDQTKKFSLPICDLCGQTTQSRGSCKRCLATHPHFTALRSWAEFGGPIQNALHDIKFRKNIGLGESLSQHLVGVLKSNKWEIDLVAPVSLGYKREKQRGYNQTALIAKPLASCLQLPYNPRILSRSRETISQVELSLAERQKNVNGAFQSNSPDVHRKSVLVIDDVTTSGSTLNACSKILIDNGARAVYGLTVTRAILNNRS